LIAELQTKKSCGIAIAELQNLTSAIPQLSIVSCQFRYFLVPFPQLRTVLKINQKCFYNCPFLWKKLVLKGQLHEIFYLRFFSRTLSDFTVKKMPKIAEIKLSGCGHQNKL
jgi:hypothetical protein